MASRSRRRALAVAVAAGLALAACSSDDTTSTAADAPADAEPIVLELSAPTADGATIDLSEFAGQDLMLWFWAPW